MSTQAVPAADPGNQLLAEVPAQLTVAIVDLPQGQRLTLTIRTATTTLTVLLKPADAKAWAAQFKATAAMMSDAGLIVAGGTAPNGSKGKAGG